jgi:hypothetical protein
MHVRINDRDGPGCCAFTYVIEISSGRLAPQWLGATRLRHTNRSHSERKQFNCGHSKNQYRKRHKIVFEPTVHCLPPRLAWRCPEFVALV